MAALADVCVRLASGKSVIALLSFLLHKVGETLAEGMSRRVFVLICAILSSKVSVAVIVRGRIKATRLRLQLFEI